MMSFGRIWATHPSLHNVALKSTMMSSSTWMVTTARPRLSHRQIRRCVQCLKSITAPRLKSLHNVALKSTMMRSSTSRTTT